MSQTNKPLIFCPYCRKWNHVKFAKYPNAKEKGIFCPTCEMQIDYSNKPISIDYTDIYKILNEKETPDDARNE